MLSRKEWSVPKIQPDVFSLESLIAWLERQPADQEYDFNDCFGGCLLDQYADAMGLADDLARYTKLNDAFDTGRWGSGPRIALTEPWTFGAALSRARANQRQ